MAVIRRVDPDERLFYRPEEAGQVLSLPRSEVYLLIQSGRLRSTTHGRRRLIPRAEIERFASELLGEAGTADAS